MDDVMVSDSQKRLMSRLDAENAKFRRQRNKYKERADAAEKAVADLTKGRDDAAKASDAAMKRAAELEFAVKDAPSKAKDRIAELEAKIRDRAHRDAFAKAVKAAGVPDDRLDAAWKLAGWQAEGDEPDETKLGEVVSTLIQSNTFLKGGHTSDTEAGVTGQSVLGGSQKSGVPPKPAGPGFGRGAAPQTRDVAVDLAAAYPDPYKIGG